MKYFFIFLLVVSGKLLAQTPIELKDVENHIRDNVKIEATIFGGKYLDQKRSV